MPDNTLKATVTNTQLTRDLCAWKPGMTLYKLDLFHDIDVKELPKTRLFGPERGEAYVEAAPYKGGCYRLSELYGEKATALDLLASYLKSSIKSLEDERQDLLAQLAAVQKELDKV